MKTTAERYRKARQELEQRRSHAEETLARRVQEVNAKTPDIAVLAQRIAECAAVAVRTIGKQGDCQQAMQLLQKQSIAAQNEREKLLLAHGFPADYLQMPFVCKTCNDSGYVLGVRCECFKALLRDYAYRELCMDAPLKNATFANFSLAHYKGIEPHSGMPMQDYMGNLLRLCQDYAETFGKQSTDLLLYGETGLGKTHLSLAIAGACIAKGVNVIYASAQNLLRQLEKARFSRTPNADESTEDAVLTCDLLLLDDLGTEFYTSFTQPAIYNLLNTRINRQLPTIINTNLTQQQLEEKYGQRVLSRLFGHAARLRFAGKDYRATKHTGR